MFGQVTAYSNRLLHSKSLASVARSLVLGALRVVHTKSADSCIDSTQKAAAPVISEAPDMLHIAENCVERLRALESGGETLRVYVEGGGCSGFQYKFELENAAPAEDDRVFERDGARVFIDSDSLQLLRGATLRYEDELIRSGFVIDANPQADVSCSCGSSFSLKL